MLLRVRVLGYLCLYWSRCMKRLRGICLGSEQVGKTTLITTMNERRYRLVAPTMGVDHCTILCEETRFICWDTSGNPKFKSVVEMFTKDCSVFMYIFDLARKETLEEALGWYDKITETISRWNTVHILIGNKKDLSVDDSAVRERAGQFPELNYYTVSARSVKDTVALWQAIQRDCAHIQPEALFPEEKSPEHRRECCEIQ